MTTTAPILVIGATGKVGSRIVGKLTALGHPVRPASRRTTPAFDWEDQSTWAPALAGADSAFVSFFPDLAAKGAPEAIQTLSDLAVAAGLKRVVLLSGRGESNAELSESIFRTPGLDCTIVRASWFNQNFSEGQFRDSVRAGFITLPAGNRREPFVDVDDIADVAVAALTDPRHAGEIYEVTGPRLLSFAEAAAEISAVTGRPLAYADISLDDFHAALLHELGQATTDFLRDLCAEVFDGRNESTSDGVQRALGRPPRDFTSFCRAAAASGAWNQ